MILARIVKNSQYMIGFRTYSLSDIMIDFNQVIDNIIVLKKGIEYISQSFK